METKQLMLHWSYWSKVYCFLYVTLCEQNGKFLSLRFTGKPVVKINHHISYDDENVTIQCHVISYPRPREVVGMLLDNTGAILHNKSFTDVRQQF